MKRFKVFVVGFFSALFVLVAVPAHSLSALLPQTNTYNQTGFVGLILGLHPVAAMAWAIVATRNLIFTVLPEPVSLFILGMSLVSLGTLLRSNKQPSSHR